MTLLDKYRNRYSNQEHTTEEQILFAVFADLFGRNGLDNAWDDIDPGIKEEILEQNLKIIQKKLKSKDQQS